MANYFTDRVVQHPGRVVMNPVSGEANTYDMSRAEGTVAAEGTPFNAATFNQIADDIIQASDDNIITDANLQALATKLDISTAKLYNLLDKLADKANKAPVITRTVTGSVVKTAGRYAQLSAPTVDGYSFVAWVYALTNGWTGYVSPSNPTLATVNFYVQYSSSPSTDSGSISGIALYAAG